MHEMILGGIFPMNIVFYLVAAVAAAALSVRSFRIYKRTGHLHERALSCCFLLSTVSLITLSFLIAAVTRDILHPRSGLNISLGVLSFGSFIGAIFFARRGIVLQRSNRGK